MSPLAKWLARLKAQKAAKNMPKSVEPHELGTVKLEENLSLKDILRALTKRDQ